MAGKTEEAKMVEKIKERKRRIQKRKKEMVEITIPPYGEDNEPTDMYLSINGKTITLMQDPIDYKTMKVPRPYAELYRNVMKAKRASQITRARIKRQNRQRRA